MRNPKRFTAILYPPHFWGTVRRSESCRIILAVLMLLVFLGESLAGETRDARAGSEELGSSSARLVTESGTHDSKANLQVINHGEFNKGRPKGFYRSAIDHDPSVCGPLLESLNKPHKMPRPTRNLASDLLLANDLSQKWSDLQGFLGRPPVSRTIVDLNSDGVLDVIYRHAQSVGSYYLYGLYWTDRFQAGESEFSVARQREVAGHRIQGGIWNNHDSNAIYVFDKWGNKQSVHPPLPEGIKLPRGRKYEIVQLGSHAYLLVIDGRYLNKRLNLFVFQTRDRRDHALVCMFSSAYVIRSPKTQQ